MGCYHIHTPRENMESFFWIILHILDEPHLSTERDLKSMTPRRFLNKYSHDVPSDLVDKRRILMMPVNFRPSIRVVAALRDRSEYANLLRNIRDLLYPEDPDFDQYLVDPVPREPIIVDDFIRIIEDFCLNNPPMWNKHRHS